MIELLKVHPFFIEKNIESCSLLENQGYCNENYLLVADGLKYIVRKVLRDDIERDFEWKVHHLAYMQQITAEAILFNKSDDFMVFEFLKGEHKLFTSEDDLKVLAKTIQKLHNITIDAKPVEIIIAEKTDEVLKAFTAIENYTIEYVLCHNDLNPQNLLWYKKELKFIDWEYAGVNDRYFDLACVCVEFKLNDGMQDLFLNTYFENEAYMLEKLEAYKVIYRVLCEEWFKDDL